MNKKPSSIQSFGAFLFSSISIAAGGTAHAESAKRGVLEVPQKVFDFGGVPQGQRVTHEFEFKNSGNADLVIQRIAPSCGCTAVSTTDNVIKAGETVKLKADFDTAGFSGSKTKTIDVFTSDLDMPQISLVIRGTVLPSVTIDPPRLDFGELVPGAGEEAFRKEFSVDLASGTDISVNSARVFSKYLTVEKISTSDKTAKFAVLIDPKIPRGSLRERVVVELQGGKRPGTLSIPVLGFVRGSVKISPATISVGIVEGKLPIERSAKVENTSKTPLKILGITSSSDAVRAEVKEIQPGQAFVVKISVDPAKINSDLRASIEVETDRKDEERLAINVFGVVPPQVSRQKH